MHEHGEHHRQHEHEGECGCGHHGGHAHHGPEGGRWDAERGERHHHYGPEGGCGCGRHGGPHHHGGGECGCGRGGWESGTTFRRRFQTREERVAQLREYLKDLQAEAQAVEERIAELSAAG